MANNVTREEHLEALANAIKDYADSKLATIGGGSAATIDDFTGATSITGGQSGLVPAPQAGDNEKFLRGDGTWVTIDSGETYSEATTLTAGLMSASDKAKLDTLTSGKNVIAGTGLVFNGDTLNCTLSGGSTGGSDTELVLSNVASTVNGAIWLESTDTTAAGEAVILSTLMPATVVNGSMWLVL